MISIFLIFFTLLNLQIHTATIDFFKIINRDNAAITVRYSPDGKYLAQIQTNIGLSIFSRDDNYAFVNSTNQGFAGGSYAYGLDYSNDQSMIAYCVYQGSNSKIRIVEANNALTAIKNIDLTIHSMQDLDFSPDNSKIMVCGYMGVQIYQVSNSSLISRKSGGGAMSSFACKFSINNYYATVMNEKNLEVYDENNILKYRYNGNYSIYGIDWNSNGSAIAFVENNKGLNVYNLSSNITSSYYNASSTSIMSAVDWSPNDKYIAFSIVNNMTIIIDALTLKVDVSYTIGINEVWQLCFSPDNNYIAQTRFNSKSIYIMNLNVVCMLGFYKQQKYCKSCQRNCLVCNNSTCQTCSSGKPIENGCTQVIGCMKLQEPYLNTSNNCKICDSTLGFELDQSNRTCKCQEGYILSNNICHNIVGCSGPTIIQNTIKCKMCDFMSYFQLIQNKCLCKSGYKLNSSTKNCDQICGDGILFWQDCVYKNILFPFTLAFFYEIYSFAYTSFEVSNLINIKLFTFLSIFFKTIAIIIIAFECKGLFFTVESNKKNGYALKDCNNSYVPLYIICYFLIINFIILSSIYSFQFYREILASVFLLLFISFICILPYKQRIDNIAQVSNMSVLVLFANYIMLNHHMPSITIKVYILSIFIFFVIVATNLLVNIMRIVKVIIEICKKEEQQGMDVETNLNQYKRQQQNKGTLHKSYYANVYESIKRVFQPSSVGQDVMNKQISAQHQKYIDIQRQIYKQSVRLQLIQTLK